VPEVTRLADAVDADLVVFSSATRQGARRAQAAAREVAATNPRPLVLTGQPGDSVRDLIQLARDSRHPGAHQPHLA
jgi:hypothetical protein